MLNTTIEQYYLGPKIILIEAVVNGQPKDYEILRSDFEAFVDRHDKREWINDSGTPTERTGLYAWEQYYHIDNEAEVKQDLIEFITINNIEQCDIKIAIDKVLQTSNIADYSY